MQRPSPSADVDPISAEIAPFTLTFDVTGSLAQTQTPETCQLGLLGFGFPGVPVVPSSWGP